MEVQLISQLLIKPSLPTPPHLQTMSISFFDQHAPPIMVPFIFYYLNHGNHPINSIQHTKRLSLLKKSLSDTLTLFYPFAGRYVKESFSVTCNDEGVVYSETLVNVQLFDILHGRFQIHELDSLVDKREESETSPLLTVQVNILKCGGLAIGIGTSHRIFDAFTSCLFTTAWAKACRTGLVDESLVPNFDGGVLFPPRDNIEMKKSPLSLSNLESQVVTERFVFKQVRPMMPTSLVIATIWRAQIKAARAKYGVPRSSFISMEVNLRGKTRKRIPENCCGNIYSNAVGRFGVEDEKEMDLDVFVEKVRDCIKEKIAEVGGDGDGDEDWFYERIMRTRREIVEEYGKGEGEGDVYAFSSVRGFPFYEVDFGWGKPAWLSFGIRMLKGVSIIDTKDGDGVEAWVAMDKEEMEIFRNDSDISSMSVSSDVIQSTKIL